MPRQLKNFVFTLNNPEEDAIEVLKAHEEISYCICQKEEVSTVHLQGYVELHKRVSFTKVAKWFKWHIEPRKGSQSQAIEYCKKDESRIDGPWEWGTKKVQGSRNDIHEVLAMVATGKRFHEIADEAPVPALKYHRGLREYRSSLLGTTTKEFRKLSVTILWGDAGTGKSRQAIEDGEDYYILNSPNGDTLWFDGYEGQKTLIIDDFYGWIKFNVLLRLLDGYQCRLAIKGSFTYAQWDKVFITSNKPWVEWYPNVTDPKLIAALERRISFINKV